ncbi:MAG: macro domain-containing protein [Candidatus Altiarchaeota archaeon]|nr:macro domain-containing protein [Candidatus Altiarchaeota archaeon]
MPIRIIATKGDIATLGCDAIVNPANSLGLMGGGAALAIKNAGGDMIERQAVRKAPIPVGKAVSTSAGTLPAGFVIHAPTMENPAERIHDENVGKATYAALELGNRLGARSIAFPGMGTGVGGVDKAVAAQKMVEAIKRFEKETTDPMIEKVILVAYDDELAAEFRKWTQK